MLLLARFGRFLFFFTVYFFSFTSVVPRRTNEYETARDGNYGGRYTCWLAFGYQLGVIGLGIYREHESILCYSGSGGTRTTAAQL
ncbi:hypothetical protein J3E69DRAFT_169101 [Trichoderma sp. SZMC 28015]